MNPERIEELLRKTSPPKAPADLLQKLTAGIRLPRPAAGETTSWRRPPSWFRRLLPALSFAGLFIACAVVLAVQVGTLNTLQQKNAELRVVKDKQPASDFRKCGARSPMSRRQEYLSGCRRTTPSW